MAKTSYLFVGSGRLSKHLHFYFNSLGIKSKIWSRRGKTPLANALENVDRVLLSIADDEIANFYEQNKELHTLPCIHFSGRLAHEKIFAAHPLMTFSYTLYDKYFYPEIPFVTERGQPNFQKLFPELKNPSYQIYAHQKAYYHALCTMAGNFATLLWSGVTPNVKSLGLPKEILNPYILQVTKNFMSSGENSLTGPLARGDKKTIHEHLNALQDTDLQPLYYSFLNQYQKRAPSPQTPTPGDFI